MKQEKEYGIGGCWIYKCSHQNDWKRKEERTDFKIWSQQGRAFFFMNAEHLISELEYIFIYFADIVSFRSLLMTFSRLTDNEPGWACQHRAFLYFRLKNESEDMWKRKRGLYSCIIYDTPLYPSYFPLANGFITSPSSDGCEDLERSTAGLLLPTSQRFQSGYKETRLKQH